MWLLTFYFEVSSFGPHGCGLGTSSTLSRLNCSSPDYHVGKLRPDIVKRRRAGKQEQRRRFRVFFYAAAGTRWTGDIHKRLKHQKIEDLGCMESFDCSVKWFHTGWWRFNDTRTASSYPYRVHREYKESRRVLSLSKPFEKDGTNDYSGFLLKITQVESPKASWHQARGSMVRFGLFVSSFPQPWRIMMQFIALLRTFLGITSCAAEDCWLWSFPDYR